jgi:hypothetical protein
VGRLEYKQSDRLAPLALRKAVGRQSSQKPGLGSAVRLLSSTHSATYCQPSLNTTSLRFVRTSLDYEVRKWEYVHGSFSVAGHEAVCSSQMAIVEERGRRDWKGSVKGEALGG